MSAHTNQPNVLNSETELVAFLDSVASCSGAIWDFDGAVVDSEPTQASAYRLVLEEEGITPSDAFFDSYIGRTESEIWKGLSRDYSLSASPLSLRKRRLEKLGFLLIERVAPNWFVRPALEYFDRRAVQSIIISSGNESVVEAYLHYWNLLDRFQSISATDPSKDVAPKADRLTTTIRALKGGRAVVVEDSSMYLAAARDAGAVTLGVSHSLNGADLADVTDAQVLGVAEDQ